MTDLARAELAELLGSGLSLAAVRRFRRFRLPVMRAQDNLVLEISVVGLTTTDEADLPRLVPAEGATRSRLIVTFPPQHVAEQVFQENEEGGSPQTPTIPAGSRFAAPSRLVFEVPAGEHIDLTVAGILEAMGRLALAVAPLAVPRRVWLPWSGPMELADPGTVIMAIPTTTPAGNALAVAMERVRATRILAATGLGSAVHALEPDTRRAVLELPPDARTAAIAGLRERIDPGRVDLARYLRTPDPRPPAADETAIEIPSRLVLSPSSRGGWVHAVDVADERGDGTGPVELWHTRLGVRDAATGEVDEADPEQRIVRGIWTRDVSSWGSIPPESLPELPFPQSTTANDRYQIVGRSSGTGLPIRQTSAPVDVNRFALSSLGGFIDVRGAWPESDTWSLAEWQHRTTLGRDQFVKVVKYGYLYPFGHRAVLVKETKRKVEPALPRGRDTAILWQRKYIILKERTRQHAERSMPFTMVTLSPITTPDLDAPAKPPWFWPMVDGEAFDFTVLAVDHDGETHVFKAPLIWVEAPANDQGVHSAVLTAYGLDASGNHQGTAGGRAEMQLGRKRIAVAPRGPSGEARYDTEVLRFGASLGTHTAQPRLLYTKLDIPAISAATGKSVTHTLTYAKAYLDHAFDAAANVGEVVLQVPDGLSAAAFDFVSSDKSGGFMNPGQRVEGLSRRLGPIAEVAKVAAGDAVDPKQLFGSFGKLFGLFEFGDLLADLGLDKMPAYVSKALDLYAAVNGDLSRVAEILPNDPAVAQAKAKLQAAAAALDALMDTPPPDVEAQIQTVITSKLLPAIQEVEDDALEQLALAQRAIVARTLDTLKTLLQPPASLPVPDPAATLATIAKGLPVSTLLNHVHLEWSPPLTATSPPIFVPGPNGQLLLAVDVRGGDLVGEPSAEIVAQLSDFGLELIPGTPLLNIAFERILFKASTGKKTEVDVVIGDLTWKGILAFVEDLKDLIPLDGFSDPPSLTVDSTGLAAGFSVELPNVAVGVFNLSNLSLAADFKLPFLGDAPSVGFQFCSRERPFTLAVMIFGGGGFFGLRLDPHRVVLLEASLEFGAYAALDFVVASGEVSVMAGVYFRLESEKGSLTGYLRIRGEVDVLGLISASIEMYMGLLYEFGSGKVLGKATITVEIEIFMFSESVKISAERRFAGSAGDPTFMDALGPYADDGPWVTYCQAFAEAA